MATMPPGGAQIGYQGVPLTSIDFRLLRMKVIMRSDISIIRSHILIIRSHI